MLRKSEIISLILEDITDPGDLCMILEISCEEILEAFSDRLDEHYYKFMLPDTTDGILEDVYDEEEEYATNTRLKEED